MKRFTRRCEARRRISDEEYLTGLAHSRRTSEYEIFHVSAARWPVSPYQVGQDFNRYLNGTPLPYYVRDYIRRDRAENPESEAINRYINPI